MKQRQTSYAFLMEMLWVSGFFILAACIFIMVFVKADRMSRGADDLNQAVLVAENALEDTFAAYPKQAFDWPSADTAKNDGTEDGRADTQKGIFYYAQDWRPVVLSTAEESSEQSVFCVTVTSVKREQMLDVTAQVTDKNDSVLYTLNGSHYIP